MAWKITLNDEFKKNPELCWEDIEDIQTWMKQQPHLPSITDLDIVMFLHACQWDIPCSKETIESYYTSRTSLTYFFSSRDPISKEIQDISKVINVTFLPLSDKEGNRILWVSLVDPNPQHYSFASAVKYFTMSIDVFLLENGTVPGFIIVYDVKNLSFSHAFKSPLTQVSKYTQYSKESERYIVKCVHYININGVLNKLISFLKPFMSSNDFEMLQLHSNLNTFLKCIPKEMLPKDYGGDEPTLKEMNDANLKKIEDYRQYFLEEQMYRVDESKRPGPGEKGKSSDSGNRLEPDIEEFKKLAID